MTTHRNWTSALAFALLLPGCVLAKSVGDDPEATETANAETEGNSGSGISGVSATSQGPNNTATTSAGNTESTTTTAGPTATSTSGGSPGGLCGVEEVPPGLPGYIYSFDCSGTCRYDFVTPLPLPDAQETADCLCSVDGCGDPSGEVGEVGGSGVGTGDYDGVCDVEILPNEGPGYYEALCSCELCDVHFEDISQESASALGDDGQCDCLCLEAGCGYSSGGAGVGGGPEPTGTVGDTDTPDTDGGTTGPGGG